MMAAGRRGQQSCFCRNLELPQCILSLHPAGAGGGGGAERVGGVGRGKARGKSLLIIFSVHFLKCCFSLSMSKKIIECKFKFEKHVMFLPFFFFTRTIPSPHLSDCILSVSLMGNWKTSTRCRPAPPRNLHISTFWCIFLSYRCVKMNHHTGRAI